MKGKGYRINDSCDSCKHCCHIGHYEDSDDLYCHIDKSERPLSGSVFMRESFFSDDEDVLGTEAYYEEFNKNRDAWEKWSEPRSVSYSSICDEYDKIKYGFTDKVSELFNSVTGESSELTEELIKFIAGITGMVIEDSKKMPNFPHVKEDDLISYIKEFSKK